MASGYRLGVDLGTTYTAAAVERDGRVEVCTLGDRTTMIPSLALVRPSGEIIVGEAAERRAASEPTAIAREFKRRLGDPAPLVLGGVAVAPEALMAAVLRHVVQLVSLREDRPPDRVVLSHPASYGPYKTGLMRTVARLADVPDVELVAEPQAAAISYAQRSIIEPGKVVAVYDFGGGTFDAALVRRTAAGGFDIVGQPEGIERLGGIDLDQLLMEHVLDAAGAAAALDGDADEATLAALVELRDRCQAAKEALSVDQDARIAVNVGGVSTAVRVTRDDLDTMVRPRILETVEALQRAIRNSGLSTGDLDRVLLVGGSSRIPLVADTVRATLHRPVAVDANPKTAICEGAALYLATHGPSAPPPGGFAAPVPVPPAAGLKPPNTTPPNGVEGTDASSLRSPGVVGAAAAVAAVGAVGLGAAAAGATPGPASAAAGLPGPTPTAPGGSGQATSAAVPPGPPAGGPPAAPIGGGTGAPGGSGTGGPTPPPGGASAGGPPGGSGEPPIPVGPPPTPRRRGLLIGAVAAVVVAAIVAIVIAVSGGDDPQEATTTTEATTVTTPTTSAETVAPTTAADTTAGGATVAPVITDATTTTVAASVTQVGKTVYFAGFQIDIATATFTPSEFAGNDGELVLDGIATNLADDNATIAFIGSTAPITLLVDGLSNSIRVDGGDTPPGGKGKITLTASQPDFRPADTVVNFGGIQFNSSTMPLGPDPATTTAPSTQPISGSGTSSSGLTVALTEASLDPFSPMAGGGGDVAPAAAGELFVGLTAHLTFNGQFDEGVFSPVLQRPDGSTDAVYDSTTSLINGGGQTDDRYVFEVPATYAGSYVFRFSPGRGEVGEVVEIAFTLV